MQGQLSQADRSRALAIGTSGEPNPRLLERNVPWLCRRRARRTINSGESA